MAQDGGIDAPEPAHAMKGQPLTAAWEIFQKKLAGMSTNGDGMPRRRTASHAAAKHCVTTIT